MTKEELAALLDGMECPVSIAKSLVRMANAAGLVIVYGASDDLMEFEGAIYEEAGAYGGTSVFVDAKGVVPEFNRLCEEKDWHGLREYFARFDGRKEIEAIWDRDGYSWTYETEIPHATFEVVEDGAPYCRGIVFSLADLGTKA